MAKIHTWKHLSTAEKIAKLERQLKGIKNAQELLNEFERLTADWIVKVKLLHPDETAS